VREVKVVSREQGDCARRYEEVLCRYDFVSFASVLPDQENEHGFKVFVGGSREVGEEALKIGTGAVLDGEQKRNGTDHRFAIDVREGSIGKAAYPRPRISRDPLSGTLHQVSEPQDDQVRGG